MRITLFGDAALLVEHEPRIDVAVNAAVLAASERVRRAGVAGVRDVVPAYASFVVHFDPLRTDIDALREVVARATAAGLAAIATRPAEPPVEIPVCYGGDLGPDLDEVAAWAGCTGDGVVAAHAAPVYRVFLLGFLPGFPYMASVDDRIAMPRRGTPRSRVAAGSVGIAGAQTGVYPFDSPGGWRIIGRTPLRMFVPVREPAALLSAGRLVRFVPITVAEFERIRRGGPA